jgi:hypothetical protein
MQYRTRAERELSVRLGHGAGVKVEAGLASAELSVLHYRFLINYDMLLIQLVRFH